MAAKNQRLYQIISDRLLTFIREENLAPGQRLPGELTLASRFSVSRATMREAMVALEIAGEIEIRGGSGAYVLKRHSFPTPLMDAGPGPFELLEARMMVEGELAAEAALRASSDDVRRLEATLTLMQTLAAENQNTQSVDRDFHIYIAESARNSVLTNFVDALWSGIFSPMFHNLSQRAGLEAHQGMTLHDHSLITLAIRTREPQRARAAMRLHLRHVQEILQGNSLTPDMNSPLPEIASLPTP